MSFSFKNALVDRSISAALELFPDITPSKANSASSPQCQVSKKASICALDLSPCRALKQHVISRLAIEWRVQVDEIHTLIVYGVLQNREVVAVVEGVQSIAPKLLW